jgi:beta-lactam-binding protein with PASTA domain
MIGLLETTVEWLTPGPRPSRKVTVPDVVGLGPRDAGHAAAKAGLRTSVRRRTERPAPVEGVVVAQEPPPGSRVAPRRALGLDV